MRLGKSLFVSASLITLAAGGWYGYGLWLAAGLPKVEVRQTAPLAAQNERTLPFFELMSPMPSAENSQVLPKLEYKKGSPERFLERISVVLQPVNSKAAKERIIYYGRRTRTDLYGLSAFPEEPAREAHYLETAIRMSQGENIPEFTGLNSFFYGPLLLREASQWLQGVETVTIMDQAGTPAFLFIGTPGVDGRARATALFIRRNSFYRVDFLGDRGFAELDPVMLFRKSFLTERRSEAVEYLAKNLSEVKVGSEPRGSLNLRSIAWPILLLAANVSVDPASIDSYFHFAGINALLYRSLGTETNDLEISDTLRNNVLASDLYARDVAPTAPKTAEIARLARLLTRNFNQ